MSLTQEDIENRFGLHKASIEGENASKPKHAELRERFKEFSSWLNDVLTDCRTKSIAFTALEDASMWSHKAIAETADNNITKENHNA